jgi:hypothetical protein
LGVEGSKWRRESFNSRRRTEKAAFQWKDKITLAISLLALSISASSFYFSTLREVDDLEFASSPPFIDTNGVSGVSFSPTLRIGQNQGVDISLGTPFGTLGDRINIGNHFSFEYINRGTRDTVILSSQLVVLQSVKDNFPSSGPDFCEDGEPGEWAFNLSNVEAALESGHIKALQPEFNVKNLLSSGDTSEDKLSAEGYLSLPILEESLKNGKFYIRVCARFVVASASSRQAVINSAVVLCEAEFSLKRGIWEQNLTRFGQTSRDAARPQILLQGSEDDVSQLLIDVRNKWHKVVSKSRSLSWIGDL